VSELARNCNFAPININYRAAHHTAVRQTRGLASTEDLRHAMIHYRTLFEELIREPAVASPYNA
jgi:hypothetical protein